MASQFGRTITDRGEEIHLVGCNGGDASLCGYDLAGDSSVHVEPPILLEGKHKVTCTECLSIIELVRNYLKPAKNKKD